MKEFLEQYGGIILAVVAIGALILFATPLGSTITTGITEFIDTLVGQSNEIIKP